MKGKLQPGSDLSLRSWRRSLTKPQMPGLHQIHCNSHWNLHLMFRMS